MAAAIATLKHELRIAQGREDDAKREYAAVLRRQQVSRGTQSSQDMAADLDREWRCVQRAEQKRIAAQGRLDSALAVAA